MKQTMQKIAIALCMALAFAACKNDDPETGGGVETVTIEKDQLSLVVNDSTTLKAKINGVVSSEVTWKSSKDSVATVDNNGKVTAVSAGTATITATAKADKTKTATCTVSVTAQTPTSVAASDDEWNFVGKADASYGSLGTPKDDGSGKSTQTLDNDISVKGEKNQLTLVLSKASTGVGENKSAAPKYKYDDAKGLCIKGAAFKIDGIKGAVTATIQWYLNSSKARNLEVTVGVNGKPAVTSSGTTTGDKDPYTVNFDGGDGTTLYIGASDELFIKSITIKPQSGSGTQPSTPTDSDHSGETISLTDIPLGYASLGTSYKTSGGKTVTNRADLLSAIKSGGVIIINGMIDMSEGKLPAAGGKSTDSTSKLDALVHSTYSKYANYAAWVDAYSKACTLTTDDDKSGSGNSALQAEVATLNKAYGDLIKLTLKSGTTLIGKGPNCGIRGGSIQISNESNIQIRNLIIQDAFDPFPHHEVNSSGGTDGYNAQWDGINIQNICENIWIDHVTFEDTMTLGYVYTQGVQDDDHHEKWQTYDG
ncbi:MAG: Ig-like domain-containing protein, partial [Treponemataceae bacterium]|nr:Ig-like domain-containing protein [Treponemataceae bacterium]